MLVFVDESWREDSQGTSKTTYAAVLVGEGDSRDLARRFFNLKKQYWKISNPWQMEIKGRKLLRRRKRGNRKVEKFMENFFELCMDTDIVWFAVTRDGEIRLVSDSNYLPELYRSILWRINTYMKKTVPAEKALMFFDARDEKANRKVAQSFTNFMYRHRWGHAYRNVIETPFFVDSIVTPGVQIADIVAYCVNERQFDDRQDIIPLYEKFENFTETLMDGKNKLPGFFHLPSNQ